MVTNYDTTLEKPKITNGSLIIIGSDNAQRSLNIIVDKHFNWFQKFLVLFGLKKSQHFDEWRY